MEDRAAAHDGLSLWWTHTVILIIVAGVSILPGLAAKTYQDAPPIPERSLRWHANDLPSHHRVAHRSHGTQYS